MPDFFHVAHEIVKSYSLAIGQRWRHAQQELTKATELLARHQGDSQRASDPRGASAGASAASRGDALGRGKPPLSGHLERLSLTLHPFLSRVDAPPPHSRKPTHGGGRGNRSVSADHQLPARHRHDQGPQAIPALRPRGYLVARGPPDLEPFLLSPMAAVGARVPPTYGLWARCLAPVSPTKAKIQAAGRTHLSSTPSLSSGPHVLRRTPGERPVKAFQRARRRRRAQRLSIADASQSRPAQTAYKGGPCCIIRCQLGWTRSVAFQTDSTLNGIIPYRLPPTTQNVCWNTNSTGAVGN